MPIDIDFQPYSRAPRIDALGGIALVRRMIRAGYAGKNKSTIKALDGVRTAAVEVQEEIKKRGRTARATVRPIDAAFDNGWTGLRDRLAAWSMIHDVAHQKPRARAEQLVASYFPDGVDFVKLSFEEEWVHSEALLERFEDERVGSDIERLAGAQFLANVRLQHSRLGEAVGLSGKSSSEEVASTTGVAERVAKLAAAIGDYTRRCAGEVDTDDAASVAAFRKSMAPLDAYRASGSGTPVKEEKEEDLVDPSEPLPPVPAPVG